MKTNVAKIPKGYVPKPISTLPPATHMKLSAMFSKLAQHHAAMGANKPDAANAPLMRPDAVAKPSKTGFGASIRQPIIGSPNSPYA